MYFVKYGTEYLHDPRVDGCVLLDLSLEAEENSCGYCDFTIYPTHPMYNKLKERDADNPIEVYDDDTLLFAGFIYELGKEFYLDGHVRCKGELDYLSESIVRPYSTLQRGYGSKAPNTVGEYFEFLIEEHNKQVKANKRFTIGVNQGGNLIETNFIFRENDKYPKTIDEIKEQLLDILGGYLSVRYEKGVRYIDYLSEWTNSNSQILDFGVNLTDYTQTDDAAGVATFVVPLGARMSETEYDYNDGYYVTSDTSVDADKEYYTLTEEGYFSLCSNLTEFESGATYYEYIEEDDESNLSLTVEELPNGEYSEAGYKKSGDMVYCETAVQKYGWIGVTYSNPDIFEREELITKGTNVLKELVSPKRTIEIKAVDMHLVNPSIKPIRVGEYVRVRSIPHNLDSYFLCRNIDLDLNNPENSLYTLGTTFDTLTGQQNKRINALNSTINKQYEAATAISEEAKAAAKEASETAKKASTDSEAAKEAAGSAIVSVEEEYAVSLTRTAVPTDGWSTETPDSSENKYIWRRTTTTYGDGTVVTSEPVLLTGPDGEDAVLLRIDSSRGTVFKNNSISTVLSVTIYKGSEQITDIVKLHEVFGSGAYLQWRWQKVDEEEFGVISSDDPTIGNNGFTLTISADDVDTKVTFMCELVV